MGAILFPHNFLIIMTPNFLRQVTQRMLHPGYEEHDYEVDNLNPTEDGEAGEKPHGAADEAELGLQGHLHILLNLIIGGCVKVYLDQLQGGILNGGI